MRAVDPLTKNDIWTTKACVTNNDGGKVPVRGVSLSNTEKIFSQNTQIDQFTSAKAIMNSDANKGCTSMIIKNQDLLSQQIERGAELAPFDKNKTKQLLKRYSSAFALTCKMKDRTAVVKQKVDNGEVWPNGSIPLTKQNEIKKLLRKWSRTA